MFIVMALLHGGGSKATNNFVYNNHQFFLPAAAPLLSSPTPTTNLDLISLSETLLHNSVETAINQYFVNGYRELKQYRVEEEENQEENDLKLDFNFTSTVPSLYSYTLSAPLLPAPSGVHVGNGGYLVSPFNGKIVRSFYGKNHGPIALGSGSLGVLRDPVTGAIFLGSGSLGYISPQQHQNSLVDILKRHDRTHLAGPLHFGHQYD